MDFHERADVVVIGGGYYGCFVALEAKKAAPDLNVVVLEKEEQPFTRASSTNQGQFHMGYIYSADPELALECAHNKQNFIEEFGNAVDHEVSSLYGVHETSEVSAEEYGAFCDEVGLELREVDDSQVFGDDITAVFATEEKTFNAEKMPQLFLQKLGAASINLITGASVEDVVRYKDDLLVVGDGNALRAKHVFNAAFADINNLHNRMTIPQIPLQYDVFLHFLLNLPEEHAEKAVTTIRGPFASLMPSIFRKAHILASGKFRRVQSSRSDCPQEFVSEEEIADLYEKSIEDAATYMPILRDATLRGHTIGTRAAFHNSDTGTYTSKPSLFKDFNDIENYHVVLGGKVSCMFEVSEPVKDVLAA